ncbi:hypothetical protein E2C01_093510 [Portunus trituberculatus]|uniref:Uncharacterized protein n=1 Tax=Portunus trituberculatus TaxID=210409 RepID=A0A5B7JYX3_PORTR|nr:hypothetical protein [Portunus trituberculatus]
MQRLRSASHKVLIPVFSAGRELEVSCVSCLAARASASMIIQKLPRGRAEAGLGSWIRGTVFVSPGTQFPGGCCHGARVGSTQTGAAAKRCGAIHPREKRRGK